MPPPSFCADRSPRIVFATKQQSMETDMSAMESLLQASPEIGEALIELMSECDGVREFGRRVLALSAMHLCQPKLMLSVVLHLVSVLS